MKLKSAIAIAALANAQNAIAVAIVNAIVKKC